MMYLSTSTARGESVPAQLRSLNPLDWEARAIAACTQAERQRTEQLCQQLTAQILELTGQTINPDAIYTDTAATVATLVLGTVTFRLRSHGLHLVRPCLCCGIGHFESAIIRNCSDLGYALSRWDPRCEQCREDDEDWTCSW